MESWTTLINDPVYSGALVGAAVILLVILFFLRRRRAKSSPAAQPKRSEGVWHIIDAYKESHPSFFKILEAFQANHPVDQLCRSREVMEAFQRLDRLRSELPRSRRRTSSALQLLTPETEQNLRAPHAAMTTILKSIFSEETYTRDLPAYTTRELDEFLDSLTR